LAHLDLVKYLTQSGFENDVTCVQLF